jgi:putative DNA methylase
MPEYRKKLIEVALPLEAINKESAREKSIRHGHPSTLHLWWSRKPLATSRAVLFAQMVDDPSSRPDEFSTEESQEAERQRLFRIIEELVKWSNTTNEAVLHTARVEIARSAAYNHGVILPHNMTPDEVTATLKQYAPPVNDPFCGGGSIPLEGQRLGMEAHGSDLNPVAVLITKALVEIPPKFAGRLPVNPEAQRSLMGGNWHGAHGLAEDIRYYGKWMRDEAERHIGYLYPKVTLPKEYGGGVATVIAWLWVRTVTCPNPACGAQMPLTSKWWLSKKKGKEAWVEPQVDYSAVPPTIRFAVTTAKGKPQDGTVNRQGARCIACSTPVPFDYVRSEGKAGRMEAQLMAIVAEGQHGRAYLSPNNEQVAIAEQAKPVGVPETDLPEQALGFRVQLYGMTKHRDLFTPRQLVALTAFSDLVQEAREKVLADAQQVGFPVDGMSLNDGGTGANAYADAVATYLAIALDKGADYWSTICSWHAGRDTIRNTFARQAIPMIWDFAEANPFSDSTGNFQGAVDWVAEVIKLSPCNAPGEAKQRDATTAINGVAHPLISTDPPYYDNIGYADLADFFYIWLRRSLYDVYPDLFRTMLVPKAQELVATPYRFEGNKSKAQEFFETGLGHAFERMRSVQHPDYPLTVYYAFKQAESEAEEDEGGEASGIGNIIKAIASTGWETMLEGLIRAGFTITGTWPVRTEMLNRSVGLGTNALASSIVMVCRPRLVEAQVASRRQFLNALRAELPAALKNLQRGSIAPVDLAQATIGPGMAVFSRYSKVLESDGTSMRVRAALQLINQMLDEVLAEQEGEYDADTRWAVAWFEQYGLEEGPYGVAETLSKAKNTAVGVLVEAGILRAQGGKVRLLRRDEFSNNWNPTTTKRLTVWEVTQRLIRALQEQGDAGAAAILNHVGAYGEVARDLAYRLYTVCERKKWVDEALAYNSLVVEWSDISGAVEQRRRTTAEQAPLFS